MSTVKTAGKKDPAKMEKVQEQKPAEVQKSTTKISEILNPTAEERIRKMENFRLLAEKFQYLRLKQDELEKFIMSSDGMKEKIVLSNARGITLEVSNTQVVEKVQNLIKDELNNFLSASENEILKFTV